MTPSSAFHLKEIIVLGLSALLLAGCAGPGTSRYEVTDPSDQPGFSGPYAETFAQMYAGANSDFERDVLRDKVISDQEYADMASRFESCLRDLNIVFSGFESDGSYSTEFPGSMGAKRANELTEQCSFSFGESSIGALHGFIARNPDNLDEAMIMTACMQQNGALPSSYGPEDWKRDAPHQSFPFMASASGKQQLINCSDDPLGLIN
jgi:hypothetical protein